MTKQEELEELKKKAAELKRQINEENKMNKMNKMKNKKKKHRYNTGLRPATLNKLIKIAQKNHTSNSNVIERLFATAEAAKGLTLHD